jgi:hypothetical protein
VKRWNDAMQRVLWSSAAISLDYGMLQLQPAIASRMLRLLIRDIALVKEPEPKLLRLQVRWQRGATETIEVRLSPNCAEEFVIRIVYRESPQSGEYA